MTKLEECARAVTDTLGTDQFDSEGIARAVIEALREPGDAMIEVAKRKTTYEPDLEEAVEFIDGYTAHTAWQAMIDTILNEGKDHD